MAPPRPGRDGFLTRRAVLSAAASTLVVGFAAWAVLSTSQTAATIGHDTGLALWLVPGLMALQVFQLLISAQAWQWLLVPSALRLPALWRLRLVREGIDSLLPVAQVGGEVAAARILARRGIPLPRAAASVVVDVTLEFLSQLGFLLLALVALACIGTGSGWTAWLGGLALTAAGAAGLLAVQRWGGLRLLEALVRAIARRLPALDGASLDGLQAEAAAIYARRRAVSGAFGLHLVAWVLGSAETWAVLWALGLPVGVGEAVAIEGLGMAARSAGFAVPGAVVVQETGFALAAAAVGLPETAGLALSLVKRVKEVAVGLIGLWMWRGVR